MREGRPAVLRFDDKLRPVSQRKLDRGQIMRLLSELSDQVDMISNQVAPARFHYTLHSGCHFECRVGEQHSNSR